MAPATNISTIEKGDSFRDEVAALLTAAGWVVETEVRCGSKKVDIVGEYSDQLQGNLTVYFEAKDYDSTFRAKDCATFVGDYIGFVNHSENRQCWLISRGEISPDGREKIQSNPGLRCYTYKEFQNTLMDFSSYIRALFRDTKQNSLNSYFINSRAYNTDSNIVDLLDYAFDWVLKPDSKQLAIMGDYGAGKSTFARKFAFELAKESVRTPTNRIPIVIPLGELASATNLRGLLGSLFAAEHNVRNYHFDLFKELNRSGRFVILFDGLDEMKHGMTPRVFNRVFTDLMQLDSGDAKIIVLGRPTAFLTEKEESEALGGKKETPSGAFYPSISTNSFARLQLKDFEIKEAHDFIEKYFHIYLKNNYLNPTVQSDANWIFGRIQELKSGEYDQLIRRPVHAKMLAEIATDPEQDLTGVDRFSLYDRFVLHLIEREVAKPGRDPSFTLLERRKYNAVIATWLWMEDQSRNARLDQIPIRFAEWATNEQQDIGSEELHRELLAGCMLVKQEGVVYFGHRSIQEFLIAEHLFETVMCTKLSAFSGGLVTAFKMLNEEIASFVLDRVDRDSRGKEFGTQIIESLRDWTASNVPASIITFLFDLATKAHWKVMLGDIPSPWWVWISHCEGTIRNPDESQPQNTQALLARYLGLASAHSPMYQAAVLYLFLENLARSKTPEMSRHRDFIATWANPTRLVQLVEEAKKSRNSRPVVSNESDFLTWAFVRAITVEKDPQGTQTIVINLKSLKHCIEVELGENSIREFEYIIEQAMHLKETVQLFPVQQLYAAFEDIKDRELDKIREFFNDKNLRERINAPEVSIRKARHTTKPPTKPERETLSLHKFEN